MPPKKTAEVSGGSGGAAPGSGERGRRRREDAPRVWARRGRALGWKWDSVSYGKAGPGELFGRLSSFGGIRPRAPEASQPRGRKNGGWQTWNESAPGIRIAGIVAGAAENQVHSFRPPTGLRDGHCSSSNQVERLARGSCVSVLGGREGGGQRGWGGVPRVQSASPRVSPPTRPSQSFFLAPSPGWRDRRGLALDLRGAPQVFNDSLKEAVGKVERDEADVGRVSLLCKSRKGSWEPCGWPQAPAPRRQQVGGGAAAASPIPLPSLARCALAAGAERVRGLAVPPPPCSLTCLLRSAPGGPRHGLLRAAPAARPALLPPRTPGSGGQ